MEFAERLFLLIHGLPVPEEPAQHLRSDEPGPMQKFIEKLQFDHAMGKRPVAGEDYEVRELLTKFLAPRDSRDEFGPTITIRPGDFEKRFGEVITPQPGGDLGKRAPNENRSGAIRFEVVTVGTDKWRHGFDERRELVSAYLMNTE